MKLLRTTIAALAALAFTAPAHAQSDDLPLIQLNEAWSAYKAICLAHPGDVAAQVSTAKAAPFGMSLTSDEGLSEGQFFTGPRLVLMVAESDEGQFCMVLGHVSNTTVPADGQKLAEPAFGKPTSTEDGSLIWLDGNNPPKAMHIFKVDTSEKDKSIAGYGQMTM